MRNWADNSGRQLPASIFMFIMVILVSGMALLPTAVRDRGGPTQDNIAMLCSLQDSFAVIAQKARPGVVSITAIHKGSSGSRTNAGWIPAGPLLPGFRPSAQRVQGPGLLPDFSESVTATGSGVIVKRSGDTYYVLTNHHVVGNAGRVKATLMDGTELKARVVGIDPATDLAVVALVSPKLSDENVLALGDSDDVEVGAWAIALGSPLGFNETMTVGVVSALKRQLEDEETLYPDLIQTDAAINPGNSGGPLLDVEGNVIGVNTAIASPTGGFIGLGFAIPINVAKAVLDPLIADGRVMRGWLGVGIQDLTPVLEEYYGTPSGVLVASVDPKGPGKRADLRDEDVLVSINGTPLKDIFHMQSLVSTARPGSQIKLSVVRDHRPREILAVVAQSPRTPPAPAAIPEVRRDTLGLRVRTLNDDLARRVGMEGAEGVIVVDITTGGIAEESGLDVGDVITHMNGQGVVSDKEFAGLADTVKAGGVMALKVIRDGSTRIVGMKRE